MRIISRSKIFDSEVDCYSKIWDYYYEEIMNHEFQQIPICLLIIKLMNILRQEFC